MWLTLQLLWVARSVFFLAFLGALFGDEPALAVVVGRAVGEVPEGHLVELDTARYGAITMDGPPWRFAATPAQPPRPGGPPGEHTADGLTDWGFDAEAIAALQASGAVGSALEPAR